VKFGLRRLGTTPSLFERLSKLVMALKLEKVLITDKTDPKCKEILERGGISVDVKLKLPKEELLKEIQVSML
jgi:hypothetical protein